MTDKNSNKENENLEDNKEYNGRRGENDNNSNINNHNKPRGIFD